jgi:hypothetical protein
LSLFPNNFNVIECSLGGQRLCSGTYSLIWK